MKIINIKKNKKYLEEYIRMCSLEWGNHKTKDEMEMYVKNKIIKILNGEKVISVLGLINNDILIGFISLFKYDGEEMKNLTPWYATMYVKKEYRNKGYSKILNDALLKEARRLNYNQVYLKSNLVNYYEKFGAKYIKDLNNGEKLFCIHL